MFKVMLLDDEIGVRNSIKSKIDWPAAGFEIAYEASHGKEGLRLLESAVVPDLIITDIRMPQMDGIEFIRECNSRFPGLRFVVLSGYSDFEYMKAAIQLGVKDYLLKPVVRSDLTSLLERLAGELEEERRRAGESQKEKWKSNQQLQLLQEQFLLQMVKDDWYSVSAVKERLQQLQLTTLAREDLRTQFVMLELRVPEGRLSGWQGRRDLLQLAFQMLCRETAAGFPAVYPIYDVTHPSMMFFLLVLPESGSEREAEGITERFVQELKHNVVSYLRLQSVAGVGDPVEGLQRLKNGYASCMLSWSQSTVHEAGSVRQTIELAEAFSPDRERKMIHAIENLDKNAFSAQLSELFPPESDSPKFSFTFLALRIILMFNSIAKKFEIGNSSLQQYLWNCQMTVATYQSREQVMDQIKGLAHLIIEAVKTTRSSSGQRLIETVRKYVEENYPYELSLASLADMFHMNETYLSGLFKQHVGMTFSDYLTRLRMAKAEELLKENGLKLTDIAMLVGYSSSSYFSTSFKKHYGKSPKEYREAFQSFNKS